MKILLVDDDPILVTLIKTALAKQGYAVDLAKDGLEGWELVKAFPYDLLLLDFMLPGLDGISFCHRLRAEQITVPVLLLSGRGMSADIKAGLDAGADDYVVKPFDPQELLARIRALLRRGNTATTPILSWGKLHLNPSTRDVSYANQQLNLTPKEYAILELFLRNRHRVFSRSAILDQLWSFDDELPGEETVKVHIKGLRQKFKSVGAEDLIETLYGQGYRLNTAYLSEVTTKSSVNKITSSASTEVKNESTSQPHKSKSRVQEIDFNQPLLLIVDSDTELTEYLVSEASEWKLRTAIAPTLSVARQLIQQEQPNAILLELALNNSDENGLTLLAELSTRHPSIPVIVFSARDRFTDRMAVARLGAKTFLAKPITSDQVFKAVNQALRQNQPTPLKILAVDDDPQMLLQLQLLLKPWGIDFISLQNPSQVWEALETSKPDLLILDIEMPEVSGLELCQTIRNDPSWSWLPILFISGHTSNDMVCQVFEVGADDYITKPIMPAELISRVFNRLERTRLLRSVAETDVLTGVLNRHHSTQNLEQFLHLAGHSQQPVSFALIDIGELHPINSQFGHAMGDRILRQLGQLLKQKLRQEDVIARWSGSEFVVGMYGVTWSDCVEWLAAILEALRSIKFTTPNHETFHVSFSAGVAQYPSDGANVQELYRAAETALHQAKHRGGNCVLPTTWQPLTHPIQTIDVAIIEPNFEFAHSIQLALQTRGYHTQHFGDGETAIAHLKDVHANPFNLILLNHELPDLNGLQVLKKIGTKTLKQSKVISLISQQEDAEKIFQFGVSDYLTIPYSIPVLVQRLRTVLRP